MSGIMSLLLAAKTTAAPNYVVSTFLASGTWTCPTGVSEVEYLVVAGGAGGGSGHGGGGGAGGFPPARDLALPQARITPLRLAAAALREREHTQLLPKATTDRIPFLAPLPLREAGQAAFIHPHQMPKTQEVLVVLVVVDQSMTAPQHLVEMEILQAPVLHKDQMVGLDI